jgi:hypothetical protein
VPQTDFFIVFFWLFSSYVTRKFQRLVNDKTLRLNPAAQSMAIAEHEEVEVVICQPGDTMIFRPNDAHSVFTVFPEGTPASEQWAMINGQTWLSRYDLAGGMRVLRSIGSRLDGDYHVARMYRNAIRQFEPRYEFPVGLSYRDQVHQYALDRGLVNVVKSEAARRKGVKRLAKLANFGGRN